MFTLFYLFFDSGFHQNDSDEENKLSPQPEQINSENKNLNLNEENKPLEKPENDEITKEKSQTNLDSEKKDAKSTDHTEGNKNEGLPTNVESTGDWGWDSWADDFISSAASKVTNILETVEGQLGIPDPMEMAKKTSESGTVVEEMGKEYDQEPITSTSKEEPKQEASTGRT